MMQTGARGYNAKANDGYRCDGQVTEMLIAPQTYLRLSAQYQRGCVFCHPDPLLVGRTTENFGACLDVAPLTAGHLIVYSSEHYSCSAELPASLFGELDGLRSGMRSLLERLFGPVIVYEHGREGHCLSEGPEHRLCHHFHSHCVAVDVDLNRELSARFVRYPMASYSDVIDLYDEFGNYLYFEDTSGTMNFYSAGGNVERHLFRTLIANHLDSPERAEWLNYKWPEILEEGLLTLRNADGWSVRERAEVSRSGS
jgi:hypothetical protein